MSPRTQTTLQKLIEGIRLIEDAAAELEATHPLGITGTRLRVNAAIAALSAEVAPTAETEEPEVTNDG